MSVWQALYAITMLSVKILRVLSCVYVMKDLMVMDLTAQVMKMKLLHETCTFAIITMHSVTHPGIFKGREFSCCMATSQNECCFNEVCKYIHRAYSPQQ